MAKPPPERPTRSQHVPSPPAPSSRSDAEGMEHARDLSRRYLPDTVRLLAGIALAPDSEAALHTKLLAAKEIVAIAGVIPQASPAPPALQGERGDSGEPS